MGNVNMEARQIHYRGGEKPMSVEEAIKKAGSSYVLPIAASDTLGGIKVGDNLDIEEDGTLNAAAPYTLPAATAETLGGVKVGDDLAIDENGVLSVEVSIPQTDSYKISVDGSGNVLVAKYHAGVYVSTTTCLTGEYVTTNIDNLFTVTCGGSPYWIIALTEASTEAPAGTTYGWEYGQQPTVSEIDYAISPVTGTASEFIADILEKLPAAPAADGNYKLRCTVSSGTATYSWVSDT